MFATFYLEREPLSLADLPAALTLWLQNAGAVAALGLALWCLAYFLQQRSKPRRVESRQLVFIVLVCLALTAYLIVGLLFIVRFVGIKIDNLLPATGPDQALTFGDWLLSGAGGFAILAALYPILRDFFLARIRWGRVWAIARLSLKEAIHSRIVLVFSLMAVIFLFADWFVPYKAEDQLRNYVRVVYWSITPIFLITASLLGSFSIPNDVKSQSIHTIVTKPVEKFEIVLGRFLGYGALITLGLAAISGLSLLYLWRGVNAQSAEESYKARVPIYGDLSFVGTKGESVGRMFEIRKYITGANPQTPNAPKQYAIWKFDDVPSVLGTRSTAIPVEFDFDIFRLTKTAVHDQAESGIFCTFVFADGRLPLDAIDRELESFREQREKRRTLARREVSDQKKLEALYQEIEGELAYQHGVYEVAGKRVVDYHTQGIGAPAQLFKKLSALELEKPRQPSTSVSGRSPILQVLVSVDRGASAAQMLGVAKRDLYILAAEGPFWINFLKGIIGMWFTFMLVLGVAISCSTYLSGVISWLCTIFLFAAGMFVVDIDALAKNKVEGGGPLESFSRVVRNQPPSAPLDATPGNTLIKSTDDIYRWFLRRFLGLIPDIGRYDLTAYVANGFDISWTEVLLVENFLPLLAYLIPWGVLAYYLMKFREIANPT